MNILCVDDDANFLDLTTAFLQRKLPAATLYTATRIREAFDLLESEPIHCIVSDHEMPGRTGLEFLSAVREEYPELPFILFTGKGSEEIASKAISAGVTDYLQKRGPEQHDRLAARIENAVEKYQTERMLRERIKELTAIQTVGDLLADETARSREQLREVTTQLPKSFQFPELAVAQLVVGEDAFRPSAYDDPSHTLSVHGETAIGEEITLSVGYVDDPLSDPDEALFFPEERTLLRTILQLVTAYLDRQHVLEELKEAHHRLQLILENTTAVMYLKDTDGRYVFVNAEYERLFDLEGDSITGRTDEDIHPPEMAADVRENDRRVLETERPVEDEERIFIDGDERVYLSLKVPARNDAGEIEGVFGVSTDVTETKRYERQLQEEKQLVEAIFSSLSDVFYAFDAAGALIRWNDEFEAVCGYGSEEIESMHVSKFVSEADLETVERSFRSIFEDGRSITEEFSLETKDGTLILYEFTGSPLEDADGNTRGVTGIGRDLSERETREHQLEALNHTVEQLLSADTPEEIAEFGVDAAREVLGLKANAIHFYDDAVGGLVPVAHTETLMERIGQPPTLMPGESTAWRVFDSGVATAIDDVRDDPDVYDRETSIQSELYVPLGEYGILIAGSQTGSWFDERDVTAGELLASHLVSALEQLEHEQQLRDREAELKRQNERLDQFSSMVSHDLRNPVSIANGYLELYRESGDEADLEAVEQALERVEELITDLTTIARHGSTDEERERVSLPALAEDAWAMIDTRSATLVADECTVTADRSQLQGLFENLFRNAVGHGGADVTVRVGPIEDGFYVEDTGSGIPPDEREQVFEQGYSTGYSGSGVGLTIVTRIAQAHGWRVSLTESDEGGARFEFRDADEIDEAEG